MQSEFKDRLIAVIILILFFLVAVLTVPYCARGEYIINDPIEGKLDYGSCTNYIYSLEERLEWEKSNRTNIYSVTNTIFKTIQTEDTYDFWEEWDSYIGFVIGAVLISILK